MNQVKEKRGSSGRVTSDRNRCDNSLRRRGIWVGKGREQGDDGTNSRTYEILLNKEQITDTESDLIFSSVKIGNTKEIPGLVSDRV